MIPIGTRVRVNEDTQDRPMSRRTWLAQSDGSEGRVTGVAITDDWVEVSWDGGVTANYPERDLIIVEEAPQREETTMQVGSRVVLNEHATPLHRAQSGGGEGVVVEPSRTGSVFIDGFAVAGETTNWWRVRWDNRHTNRYSSSELSIVSEQQEETTMQVGDMVRLVAHGTFGWEGRDWTEEQGLEVGKVYQVHQALITSGSPLVTVYGSERNHHPSHFELATIQVGDVVCKANGENFRATGERTDVVRDVRDGRVWFERANGWVRQEDLLLVPVVRVPQAAPPVQREEESNIIEAEDVVYLNRSVTDVEPNRIEQAGIVPNKPYTVEMVTRSSGYRYVRVRDSEGNLSGYVRAECFTKERDTDKLYKFWMVIGKGAKQTGKRYDTYDEAIAATKSLCSGNPDEEYAILEALVGVKADGDSVTAEILEG